MKSFYYSLNYLFDNHSTNFLFYIPIVQGVGKHLLKYTTINITFLIEMRSQPVPDQEKQKEMEPASTLEEGSTGIDSEREETHLLSEIWGYLYCHSAKC